jgi:hypothetical protein
MRPVFLPCFHSVCFDCLHKLNKQEYESGEFIECPECHKASEPKPSEEYQLNEALEKLLHLTPTQVTRGSHFEGLLNTVKTKANDLTGLINYSNGIAASSESKVYEYCSKLRNSVDLTVENKIEQLNRHRERLLRMINEYQNECIANLNVNLKLIFEKNPQTMSQVSNWQALMNRPNCLEKELNEIERNTEETRSDLERKLDKYEEKLFCMKRVEFVKNDKEFEEEVVGALNYTSLEPKVEE